MSAHIGDRIRVSDLFDLTHTLAYELLSGCEYPWEALAGIKAEILRIGSTLDPGKYECIGEGIWIARGVEAAPTAVIQGPCIIGAGTQLRPGAYIRGGVLIGEGAVIGNSVELKNCIIFDGCEVPHFNYVGDSILGYRAHMGAGAITSNIKGDKLPIVVHGQREYPTGLRKFGALLGDHAEIGCNSVLNPGAIIGRGARVYPLSSVRGVIPEGVIYKAERGIHEKR